MDNSLPDTEDLIVKLQIKNADMKQWLAKNGDQINLVVSGLIESMYKAEMYKNAS